jgi:hypothetical protein
LAQVLSNTLAAKGVVSPRPRQKSYSDTLPSINPNQSRLMVDMGNDDIKMVRKDDVRVAFRAAYKPGQELKDGAKDERFRKALAGHDQIERKMIGRSEYLMWRLNNS